MRSTLDVVVDSFRRNLGVPKDISKGVLKEVAEHVSDQMHGTGIEEAVRNAIAEASDEAA